MTINAITITVFLLLFLGGKIAYAQDEQEQMIVPNHSIVYSSGFKGYGNTDNGLRVPIDITVTEKTVESDFYYTSEGENFLTVLSNNKTQPVVLYFPEERTREISDEIDEFVTYANDRLGITVIPKIVSRTAREKFADLAESSFSKLKQVGRDIREGTVGMPLNPRHYLNHPYAKPRLETVTAGTAVALVSGVTFYFGYLAWPAITGEALLPSDPVFFESTVETLRDATLNLTPLGVTYSMLVASLQLAYAALPTVFLDVSDDVFYGASVVRKKFGDNVLKPLTKRAEKIRRAFVSNLMTASVGSMLMLMTQQEDFQRMAMFGLANSVAWSLFDASRTSVGEVDPKFSLMSKSIISFVMAPIGWVALNLSDSVFVHSSIVLTPFTFGMLMKTRLVHPMRRFTDWQYDLIFPRVKQAMDSISRFARSGVGLKNRVLSALGLKKKSLSCVDALSENVSSSSDISEYEEAS